MRALPSFFRARGLRRGPRRAELLLFAGRSNPDLAQRIAARLGTSLGAIDFETFSDGETYCRFGQSIRGADVFLLQSCSQPVNDHLVELLLMIDAARLASAARITAVMPWFPYSRQDKKAAPREPISARLVAELLQTAGADRVLTMDLHAGQIQGFFRIPVDHMTALPIFVDHYRAAGAEGPVVVVSPDLGRVKLARTVSHLLDTDFAVVTKTRPAHEVAEATEVIGDVRGKLVLLGDDMIVTGGTLVTATEAMLAAGARDVRAFATHALFAPGALASLEGAGISEIVVTDTVALGERSSERLEVLSAAQVLAETIESVFSARSVSAIFGGLNQPF
jgi:ribose-phosphate pyrophosphokinase